MSHTPGPWRYESGQIIGAESVHIRGWPVPRNGVSNASFSERVCENLGDISLPGPAANARLIAAAPDLLAALLLAQDAMRAPLDDWKGEVERVALDAARAAIAKATEGK